ncbi:Serine/threonine-protein kinase UCN [Linum grandiflorum]
MQLPPPHDAAAAAAAEQLSIENLVAVKILGKGAMGTVFLVHDRASDRPYALKVVDKANFVHKFEAEKRARWEIQVLTRISDPTNSHPFLPRLISSAETPNLLAWAVPYCPGGDLNVLRHRQNDRVFSSPAVVRFYLAEIVCALERLHEMGIVYRDLKPENILIQQSGHVTLTDFDLSKFLGRKQKQSVGCTFKSVDDFDCRVPARKGYRRGFARWMMPAVVPIGGEMLKKTKSARVSPVSRRKFAAEVAAEEKKMAGGERSYSFVGTEEYVSPEVVRGDGHEFAVDWWALGILGYEMTYGTTPFKGKNRKETFRNVVTKEPEFLGNRKSELTDLIGRLLEKDPTKRLGYLRGAAEIKEHEFFRGVQWDLLTEVLRPPFIPPSKDETEISGRMAGGIEINDYFMNLRAPPPMSAMDSPSSSSMSSEYCRNISLAEF